MGDATALTRRIESEEQVALRGIAQLDELREAIAEAFRAGGLSVEFDPSSSPRWVDYLAVAGPTAVEGAMTGAMLGLALGALIGAPKEGALVGGVLGAARGAGHGVDAVDRGWRIRVTDIEGVPHAVVRRLG